MKVPSILKNLYSAEHAAESFTSHALSKIAGHVEASKLEFFPEYTDHSVSHLELTLQTAIDLATEKSVGHLSASDAAVLSVAVALHDFGMHLTREGFDTLIAPGSRWRPVPEFDSKPWNELWDDFFSEAKRFDGRKLRSLFGDNYRPPRPLPAKSENWEDFDRLLVGEFLRRHHHRLAHEIALYGMPAKDGAAISICSMESQEDMFWSDMSGLVARSHGMGLRPCILYIERRYRNKVDPRRVHVVFLMALLRLADYFQIQASRAPTERTDVESFQSALSGAEWKLHQCVRDIANIQDPEAIEVHAEPEDVGTFLRLKGWLAGIQDELDTSWAVLGEVYGLQVHNRLNEFGVKIRRVKSNLDNMAEFSKTVTYVPAKVTFDAASSDLLKLLVGPLYDDNPGIGIRELIQNAVDAVREVEDFLAHRPELAGAERRTQEADVHVHFVCDADGTPIEINVSDRGVGMTADIVRDYFLKAGASFRKSDLWRRAHEDDAGQSRILRTGRFGVGALAAFLLGDEIEVTTRHVTSPPDEGIIFMARVESEAISINRVTCPVGTGIRIPIPEHMRDKVKILVPREWTKMIGTNDACGHYFLRSPSVVITFSHRDDILPLSIRLPQPDEIPLTPWRCFEDQFFQNVFWTYDYKIPALSCNGIPIIINDHWHDNLPLPITYIKTPKLSVFDKDGLLPVNLQRTGLQSKRIPFQDELIKSIVDDIMSYALVSAPASCAGDWLSGKHKSFPGDSYREQRSNEFARWCVCKDGFVLYDDYLLREFAPKVVVLSIGGQTGFNKWGDKLRSALPEDGIIVSHLAGRIGKRIKGTFRAAMDHGYCNLLGARAKGWKVYVPKCVETLILKRNPALSLQSKLSELSSVRESKLWSSVSRGKAIPHFTALTSAILELEIDQSNPMILCVFSVDGWARPSGSEAVAERWMEILGSPVIPFDPECRKGLEVRASQHLETYLRLNREELALKKGVKVEAPTVEEDEEDEEELS